MADPKTPTPLTRRDLLAGAGAASGIAAGWTAGGARGVAKESAAATRAASPRAAVAWPMWDESEESGLLGVLNSGKWGRTGGGPRVEEFERRFGERMQARHCLATSAGTTALLTALGALDIGPGDEVILPPYTFVATFNVITCNYALPVFADSDLETFQIDPARVADAVTPNTRLLLPVHIGGSVADLDALDAIARRHGIPMLEDACQAPLAEWRGVPVGTKGIGGCISFQASKNITSGEGGAVLTNDDDFANLCYNFHTPGNARPGALRGRGANYRLTEFQAALLIAQLDRLEGHAKQRDANAAYLSEMLREIPGIEPAKLTDGCTRSAWHLYMFRYDAHQFSDLPRAQFLAELGKMKIAASGGYSTLNTTDHVRSIATSRHYERIYGKAKMADWLEANQCPVNDQLCQQAVWFGQTRLLGTRTDMEQIAEAIAGIQKRSGDLAKKSPS